MDGGRACSEPILLEFSVAANGGCEDTGKNLPREFGFGTGVVAASIGVGCGCFKGGGFWSTL